MKNLFIFLVIFNLSTSLRAQKSTFVYLVRHAEKVTNDPTNKDPLLTEQGYQRALGLAKKFKNQKLSAIYCTDYQRTKLTAEPTAEQKNLIIQIYDPKYLNAFAEKILEEYKSKKLLIIGHSNTVLETIEALGGKRPIISISDNEYDYFFRVEISKEGLVTVKYERYGE